MRRLILLLPVVVVVASAQTMTEVGATAAGSAIGSAAGKKVSDGITAIFGKMDTSAKKAASKPDDSAKKEPLLDLGEGSPKLMVGNGGSESVPPPPPPAGSHHVVAKSVAPAPMAEIVPPPPPPPPPPPAVNSEDLKKVFNGMTREDLLKLGAPGSKITMSDDGHLYETFSYYEKDTSIGRVKLTDGTVSSVERF